MILSIAEKFSKTPGFRYEKQSPGVSGEEFRDNLLESSYLDALSKKEKLQVVLDGTDGYLTSFLEEAFGGLQRSLMKKGMKENILSTIEIVSNEEKHWIIEIERYVKKAIAEFKS